MSTQPEPATMDRLRQRIIRDLTSFLLSARLAPDYEHARAHAEAFMLGVPDPVQTWFAQATATRAEAPGLAALDAEIARRRAPGYQWFPKPNDNQTPSGRAGAAAARAMQHGELIGLAIARALLEGGTE